MSDNTQYDDAGYFSWRISDQTPAVLLSRDVLQGLKKHVLNAYQPFPARSSGVCGLLLGHRHPDTGQFQVEGHQPVSAGCAPQDMPFWRRTVAETHGTGMPFLGVYRAPHLAPTPADCELIETLLPRDSGVLLLVKPLSPTECVGSFFYCEGGAVIDEATGTREFSFPASIAHTVPSPIAPARRSYRNLWIPATALAMGSLAAVAYRAYRPEPDVEEPIAVETPAPINSYSALPPTALPQKPSPMPDASAAPEEEKIPVEAPPRRAPQPVSAPVAERKPGRVKRFFSGVSAKANHLWPFHSARRQ